MAEKRTTLGAKAERLQDQRVYSIKTCLDSITQCTIGLFGFGKDLDLEEKRAQEFAECPHLCFKDQEPHRNVYIPKLSKLEEDRKESCRRTASYVGVDWLRYQICGTRLPMRPVYSINDTKERCLPLPSPPLPLYSCLSIFPCHWQHRDGYKSYKYCG